MEPSTSNLPWSVTFDHLPYGVQNAIVKNMDAPTFVRFSRISKTIRKRFSKKNTRHPLDVGVVLMNIGSCAEAMTISIMSHCRHRSHNRKRIEILPEKLKKSPARLQAKTLSLMHMYQHQPISEVVDFLKETATRTDKLEFSLVWKCSKADSDLIKVSGAKHIIASANIVDELVDYGALDGIQSISMQFGPFSDKSLCGHKIPNIEIGFICEYNISCVKELLRKWKEEDHPLHSLSCDRVQNVRLSLHAIMRDMGADVLSNSKEATRYRIEQDNSSDDPEYIPKIASVYLTDNLIRFRCDQ